MNEMKPEDVMRAIKELRKHGLSNGGGLGYHAGWCDEVADLLESINALLREKDALIKDLKDNTEVITEMIEMLNNVIEEKDAEIERLKEEYQITGETRFGKITIPKMLSLGEGAERVYKEIRAEAINELAEKVKRFFDDGIYDFGAYYFEEWLDQTAKEMKGN